MANAAVISQRGMQRKHEACPALYKPHSSEHSYSSTNPGTKSCYSPGHGSSNRCFIQMETCAIQMLEQTTPSGSKLQLRASSSCACLKSAVWFLSPSSFSAALSARRRLPPCFITLFSVWQLPTPVYFYKSNFPFTTRAIFSRVRGFFSSSHGSKGLFLLPVNCVLSLKIYQA